MFPLVQEMAATGAPLRVPVVVACRVLGFSKQAYYQWVKQPLSKREVEDRHLIGVLRDLHAEDPEFGYRFLADELHDRGYELSTLFRSVQARGHPFGDHQTQEP